jgi:5-methylphenazine-1-carboxylate 1-monooxygenase
MILFRAAQEMLGANRIRFGRRIARFAQHHG